MRRIIIVASAGFLLVGVLSIVLTSLGKVKAESDPTRMFQIDRQGQWERWCDPDTGALIYRYGGYEGGVAVIPNANCSERFRKSEGR